MEREDDDYDKESDPEYEKGNGSQDASEQECHHDDKDLPVRRNKLLQICIKVEDPKAGTSSLVSKKLRKRARSAQPSVKADTQCQRKSLGVIVIEDDDDDEDSYSQFHKSKAGRSNPVSERAPPPKAKAQQEVKFPKVIDIDNDDEDLSSPSGPCGKQADQLGSTDKGESVVSEVPEVEILDGTLFSKQRILSPFAPSKRLYDNLLDDDVENLAFREDVLNVLRKPFELEEYNRLKETIRPYLHHYKDLKKRLQAQYKQEKQLAIFRGFFFWLQNLTREGSFRPWNDLACLEVEPAHVGDK